MSKQCDLCKRTATKGASRSHSKIQTLKRQNINLQAKTIDGLKLKICTSCMRTMAKYEREAVEAKEKAKAKVVALKVKAAAAKAK
ncbi:50S ribosomal protein L28 [Candidatus Falkowbacteria bacterium HGW-Falkowbacteria-2]|uniref:50S ribosomal protein L28 n=1 Tax=Candidatus Falkowbacteria bacterium HGW-Falkowbacteria-2 TaxID=2013769 RepID=A0A2N2E0C5_9BACT|nr:MAG: 50S ribosomal protein L28 [Candidatus Falkowbacteria bacterium HGW-Falkowbacteria-2]